MTQDSFIFGRLVFLFKCTVNSGEEFPLALVQPYDAGVGQRLLKDKHLDFWRVRQRSHTTTELFSVHSIVRGALLFPDYSRPGDYLVVDTVDTDMFLRIQGMHKAAKHH